jgi:two-component system, cell cycle sensor histidine kinase and response regulator CckA
MPVQEAVLELLDLLASVDRILDAAAEDYDQAAVTVTEACVPVFSGLCAIEMIRDNGAIEALAVRVRPNSGLQVPNGGADGWAPLGPLVASGAVAVLAYAGGTESDQVRVRRQRLGAESLVVAPISVAGVTQGWFVAASGSDDRPLRLPARRIAEELSRRLGATMERVRLSRSLRLAAEWWPGWLAAVADASPVPLVGVDPDGVVTVFNRAAVELFGSSYPVRGILPESSWPGLRELAEAVRARATVVSRTVSGGRIEVSLIGAPLPFTPSAQPGVLIAGVDLTEIRRAERALVHAERLETMGVVAGRIAHDFNNLLTLIIGYAELLGRGLTDSQLGALVGDIEGAARRAAELTQQMLGMGRRGPAPVVDLSAEVRELGPVLTRLAGPGVSVTVTGPEEPVLVEVDRGEIEQMVVNLVVNAAEAVDGGGVGRRGTVDVAVEAAPTDQVTDSDGMGAAPSAGAILTVVDDGPGMSGEVLRRATEPFFTTRADSGRGLGLTTVQGLVNERGGRIDIASTPGQGTSVRIWLPGRDASPVEADDAPPAWARGRTLAGRILFVDDEPHLRELGRESLTSIGLQVAAAESAEQALAVLDREGPFDALVTDIMLPGLSGVQLAAAAHQSHPDLPVLYVTGHAGPLLGDHRPADGATILRKPYRPDDLRLGVAALLADRTAQGSKR